MLSPWATDPPEEPTTNRYPATWRGDDAGKLESKSVQRRHRELREPEDDPWAEFVGAFLDRAI